MTLVKSTNTHSFTVRSEVGGKEVRWQGTFLTIRSQVHFATWKVIFPLFSFSDWVIHTKTTTITHYHHTYKHILTWGRLREVVTRLRSKCHVRFFLAYTGRYRELTSREATSENPRWAEVKKSRYESESSLVRSLRISRCVDRWTVEVSFLLSACRGAREK